MESEEGRLFNEINIEDAVSEAIGSDENKKIKSLTKTKRQLEKIITFVQMNGDFTKGKASENQLAAWDALTLELNGIGPPYHTNSEWRTIWSAHKGNLKRKSSSSIAAVELKVEKAVQSCSRYIEVQHEEQSSRSEDDERNDNTRSMFKEIINKIDALVEQQKETNELLRELISILKPQSVDESP